MKQITLTLILALTAWLGVAAQQSVYTPSEANLKARQEFSAFSSTGASIRCLPTASG